MIGKRRTKKYTPPVVVTEPAPTSSVDKDGKKIQMGSVVALQKAGRDKFTLKGKVVELLADGSIRMRAYHNGGIYWAQPSEIKRVTLKKAKNKWEDAF
jgi:hypothetical protein